MNTVLYLAWQSPTTRRWFTVGRLRRRDDGLYEFVYTRGFLEARQVGGMAPLAGMPGPGETYLSDALFPQFQNRIMSSGRPELPEHLARLGLENAKDPLIVLARNAGRRQTDSFQLFPAPEKRATPSGEETLHLEFFVHGVRHVPHAEDVPAKGERLFLMWDFQNPKDEDGLILRTEGNHNVGWVPRFYNRTLHRLHERGMPLEVVTEWVNPPGSPPWYRVFCSVTAPCPAGFVALEGTEYEPLTEFGMKDANLNVSH